MAAGHIDALTKLLSIAGPAIGDATGEWSAALSRPAEPLVAELKSLLAAKNGFYVFESALHVFPDRATPPEHGLEVWNSAELWRSSYGELADGCLFFAEDTFGVQFCIAGGRISTFDPETGERESITASVAEWAAVLLDDYQVLTGFPVAHEWQVQNGPLPPGKRLVPKKPFVLGGEFSLDNLYLLDAVTGMRVRGDLVRQIKTLPDGAQVRFEIID